MQGIGNGAGSDGIEPALTGDGKGGSDDLLAGKSAGGISLRQRMLRNVCCYCSKQNPLCQGQVCNLFMDFQQSVTFPSC